MQGGLVLQSPVVFSTKGKFPLLALVDSLPCSAFVPGRTISPVSSSSLRFREVLRLNLVRSTVTTHASNVGIGSGGYEGRDENDNQNNFVNSPSNGSSSEIEKPLNRIPYPVSIAIVLFGCALVFSLFAFAKGAPSSLLAAIAKSGFTAAFSLIFVSEIGDKTFFIAALLAMQYKKGLVLLGSMGALSLMTVLSVIIGRIFHSVPAQFQTTLPVGEYAAITLLMFFGLKSIKDAWELPSNAVKDGEKNTANLDEFVEAEELVKEKASKRLSNPLEILWKSFSLVFFAMVKGTSSTLCYKGYTAEKEFFFPLLAGHRMGMGRPFNACNNCSWCCSVSVGCGKWSHCWTPACNINCNSWRSISCQLHF